ncbi:hypothetical protein MTO96_028063 [Rhipicephalus appendiculatus]
MVLVSSFLGRSPQGLNIVTSATRLAVSAWLLATFFIGNYLQSSVTASRSVPYFAAEIRTQEQMLKHLNEETKFPCVPVNSPDVRNVKVLANFLADKKCQSNCFDEYGFGCMEKAHRGTHIYIKTCRETELRLAFKHGLMVGEETLETMLPHSTVHIRFPFRYQHRRLVMAMSESGIWMRSYPDEQHPPVDPGVKSFDVSLQDYLAILYAGLALSLVALMLEMLVHRYRDDRE